MEQPPQSERGTGPLLPTPTEMQTPLAALAPEGRPDLPSTTEKVSAAAPHPTSAAHAKFSDEAHSYVREYIRNADQKATFFFAALTAILAFLNAQNVASRWLKDVRLWSMVDALGFVSMLGLTAGAVTLLIVVFPRLKGSRRGLLFFNAIAEYGSSAEYASDVLTSSADSLVRTKLQHCYELSRICSAKYRALRIGFWLGSVGAASAVLFLFFTKTGSP